MNLRTRIAIALIGVPGALCVLEDRAEAQNLRDLARAHAADNPGVALQLTGSPGDYLPKGMAELASESEVVLRARLVRTTSYLGPKEDRILTDYRIDVEQLISGDLPVTRTVPGSTPDLRLTVYGGELRVEGVLLRATDPNRGEIMDGRSYLLFLTRSRAGGPGSYEIHYGGIFEVSNDRVRPLLKQGDRVFGGDVALTLGDLIPKLKIAGRKVR